MSMPGSEGDSFSGKLRPGVESAGQLAKLHNMPAHSLADICGHKEELRRLREAIELPLKYGEALREKGIRPAKLVIVHGPPGTGKSTMIRALAADAGLKLFTVRWPQLVARSDDDSRRLLADTMARARANTPSLIVIDDLEFAGFGYGPASELSRKKSAQIAEAIDTLGRDEKIVVVVVSTSPEAVDPTMRKAGCLVEEIEFRLPGLAERKNILALQTRGLTLEGVDLSRIAAATDGFSGADLALLVRNAFLGAFRRASANGDISATGIDNAIVTDADFRAALQAASKKRQPESRGEVN
ncbi:AAA family ATPase [Methanocella sp. MCL-LM]|uniref:AAA family ATPase n=1 Tax=Methanocella sp. MCL-LM TaxID=3412035 RepID=UPI003C72400F